MNEILVTLGHFVLAWLAAKFTLQIDGDAASQINREIRIPDLDIDGRIIAMLDAAVSVAPA